MFGTLKKTAAILAALGILGSIFGSLLEAKTMAVPDYNRSFTISEEIIPPRGNRG